MATADLTSFGLKGFYNSFKAPDERGELTGEIEVDSRGIFRGRIYDHGATPHEQEIEGHLRQETELARLVFLKGAPGRDLDISNIPICGYDLTKKGNDGSLEGNYVGLWKGISYRIGFSEDYRLFVASFNVDTGEVRDHAEVTLSRT